MYVSPLLLLACLSLVLIHGTTSSRLKTLGNLLGFGLGGAYLLTNPVTLVLIVGAVLVTFLVTFALPLLLVMLCESIPAAPPLLPAWIHRHTDTIKYTFCVVGALALLANYLLTH